MEPVHESIAKYTAYMQSRGYIEKSKTKGILCKLNALYFHGRCFVIIATVCANVYGLYGVEKFGMLDGSFLLTPSYFATALLMCSAYVKRAEHLKLVNSFNRHFLTHCEPWMVDIRDRHSKTAWKLATLFSVWGHAALLGVCVAMPALDAILHYGLDWLEKPFFLPGAFTTFLDKDVTWDAEYYCVVGLGLLMFWELVKVMEGVVVAYILLSDAFLIELKIFKEKVKSLKLEASQAEIAHQLRAITQWHKQMLELNEDLKAILGFPVVSQSIFTSVILTVTLFSMSTYGTSNIPLFIICASAFFYFFACALLYCALGQLQKNESEEVAEDLYDLPWYDSSPAVRKDLIMMIRQAQIPLGINYHGLCKMDHDHFMQILSQAYSYFTLLQTVTGEN